MNNILPILITLLLWGRNSFATTLTNPIFEKMRNDFAQEDIPVEEDFPEEMTLDCMEQTITGKNITDIRWKFQRDPAGGVVLVKQVPPEGYKFSKKAKEHSFAFTRHGLLSSSTIDMRGVAVTKTIAWRTDGSHFIAEHAFRYESGNLLVRDRQVWLKMPLSLVDASFRAYSYIWCKLPI